MKQITTLLVAACMTLAAFAQTPSTVGVALQPRTSRVVGSGTNLFTANADRAVATLATVARLATITNAVHGSVVDVRGYDADQDLPYSLRFTLNTNSVASTNRFIVANSGGVGRWVHDWDGDIRAFGAVPNDGVDDTAAFQAAANAAYSDLGYGSGKQDPAIHIPPGVYHLSSITTKVSLIAKGGSATGFTGSEPVILQQVASATNDMVFVDSDGSYRGQTIQGIKFIGRVNAGPRRGVELVSVSSRTNLSVNPSDLPSFTGWGQKGGPPWYGWIGFWNTDNHYIGAGMLKSVNTNTGDLVLEPGTDNYATRMGTNLLEVGIAKIGFGDVYSTVDPLYGTLSGGSDVRAGYSAVVMKSTKRAVIRDCYFSQWYSGIQMYSGDTVTIENCEFSICNHGGITTSTPYFMNFSTDHRIGKILVLGYWYPQTETDTWTNLLYRSTLAGLTVSGPQTRLTDSFVVGPSVYGWLMGPAIYGSTIQYFKAEGPVKSAIWQYYGSGGAYGSPVKFDQLAVAAREDLQMVNIRDDQTLIKVGQGVGSQAFIFDDITVEGMGRTPYTNDWRWSHLYEVALPSTVAIKGYSDVLGLVTNQLSVNTGNLYHHSIVTVPGAYSFTEPLLTLKLGGDTNSKTESGLQKLSRVVHSGYTNNDFAVLVGNSQSGVNSLSYGGGTALFDSATTHLFYTGTNGAHASGDLSFYVDTTSVRAYKPLRIMPGSGAAPQLYLERDTVETNEFLTGTKQLIIRNSSSGNTMVGFTESGTNRFLTIGNPSARPSPARALIQAETASGTDVVGADMSLRSGAGSGNTAPSKVTISAPSTALASGSTVQTLNDIATFQAPASPGTNQSVLRLYFWTGSAWAERGVWSTNIGGVNYLIHP